jgi:hypothetical protein
MLTIVMRWKFGPATTLPDHSFSTQLQYFADPLNLHPTSNIWPSTVGDPSAFPQQQPELESTISPARISGVFPGGKPANSNDRPPAVSSNTLSQSNQDIPMVDFVPNSYAPTGVTSTYLCLGGAPFVSLHFSDEFPEAYGACFVLRMATQFLLTLISNRGRCELWISWRCTRYVDRTE